MYKTVSRAEFLQSIDVRDIKSVVTAEHELCKVCIKVKDCDRFECQEIRYAIKKEVKHGT
jgi:hypothetical protein